MGVLWFAAGVLVLVFVARSVISSSTRLKPQEAWKKIDDGAFLVDARTHSEFSAGHIKGAANIPHSQVEAHLGKFPRNREIVVYCLSGHRSAYTIQTLRKHGFTRVFNAGTYDRLKNARAG